MVFLGRVRKMKNVQISEDGGTARNVPQIPFAIIAVVNLWFSEFAMGTRATDVPP
jgi:hypothetical protein